MCTAGGLCSEWKGEGFGDLRRVQLYARQTEVNPSGAGHGGRGKPSVKLGHKEPSQKRPAARNT